MDRIAARWLAAEERVARTPNLNAVARNVGLNCDNPYEALSEDGNPILATPPWQRC